MALVNLKTIYTDLKWEQDGGIPHSNPNARTGEGGLASFADQSKPRYTDGRKMTRFTNENQQNLFYQNNVGKLLGPIENLVTEYKNRPFSIDTAQDQKRGWSGQPFVTFNLNGDATIKSPYSSGEVKISTAGKSLVDFPIRGGNYPSREIDTERVKAFLKSDAGKLFVEKQKVLQFMNPKMETGLSYSGDRDATGRISTSLLENTRVYSSDNTLEQVSQEGTGFHLSRVGSPYFNARDEFYGDTVGMQNVANSAVTNRLEILRKLKMLDTRGGFFSMAQNIAFAKKLGISTNPTLLFNYAGGPNSSDKNRNTVVRRAVNTTTIVPNMTSMGYNAIAKANSDKNKGATKAIDFRTYTDKYSKVDPAASGSIPWDASKILENRLGTSVPIPYTFPNTKTDYTLSVSKDRLNSLSALVVSGDPFIGDRVPENTDIIKFGFECMSNNQPGDSILLLFRAFLSNGFTDNNGAQLNAFRYFGRGEEFFTYQGFTRTIGFSFKIAVRSRDELQPLYAKLNTLISQVYPDYSDKGYMRAPLVKLTIGDYLYRVPGFIESINVTADNATPWEINLEKSPDVQQLPRILEVQVSFKPIHNTLPERDTDVKATPKLITNNYNKIPVNTRLGQADAIRDLQNAAQE